MNRLARRQRAALALFIALTVSGVGVALADPQGEQPGVTIDLSPNNGQNLPDTASLQVTGAGFQSNGVGVSGLIVQAAELPNGTTALSGTLATFTSNSSGTFSQTVNVSRTFVDAGSGQTIDCTATGVQCYVQATSTGGNFQALHTISFGGGGTTTSSTTTSTIAPTTTSTSTTLPPTTTSTSTTLPPTTTSTSTTLPPTTTSTSTTLPPTTTSTSTTLPPTSTSTSTTLPPTSTSTSTSTSSTIAPTTSTTVGGPTTTLGQTQCAQIRAARAQLNAQIDAARLAVINSGLSPQQQAATLAQLEAIRAQGNAQLDALLANCPAP